MLLWAAQRGETDRACKLATLLEEQGSQFREIDIDVLMQRAVSKQQQQRINQLGKLLPSTNATPQQLDNPSLGLPILLAKAFPDWIAQRRPGNDARYVLACGAGASIASDSSLAHSQWLAVAKLGGTGTDARIHLACTLDIDELEKCSEDMFVMRDHLDWDDRAERVVAEQHKQLGKLVVQVRVKPDVSPADKAQALLSGIRQRGLSCLPWTDECREWQARVALMKTLPSHLSPVEWPSVDDETLAEELENWLLVWLDGKSSLKSLSQLDLLAILKNRLDYQQQQTLDTLLPLKYRVPSGSQIALRYRDSDNPVLAVKLQEMFGCNDNPSVANGTVILKVELLSPARRAVQITTDLANFWTNSYPAVKKDLAGRYPKHDWPDNPMQATPSAYAKRRKK